MLKFVFNRNTTRDNELEREKLNSRIQNTCPHAYTTPAKGGTRIVPTIRSPYGMVNYICEQCGAVFFGPEEPEEVERVRQKYGSLEGIEQLHKDHKKFRSLLKKEKFL